MTEPPPDLAAEIRKLLEFYSITEIRAALAKHKKPKPLHDEADRVWLAVERKRAELAAEGKSDYAISISRVCELLCKNGFRLSGLRNPKRGGKFVQRRLNLPSVRKLYDKANALVRDNDPHGLKERRDQTLGSKPKRNNPL